MLVDIGVAIEVELPRLEADVCKRELGDTSALLTTTDVSMSAMPMSSITALDIINCDPTNISPIRPVCATTSRKQVTPAHPQIVHVGLTKA